MGTNKTKETRSAAEVEGNTDTAAQASLPTSYSTTLACTATLASLPPRGCRSGIRTTATTVQRAAGIKVQVARMRMARTTGGRACRRQTGHLRHLPLPIGARLPRLPMDPNHLGHQHPADTAYPARSYNRNFTRNHSQNHRQTPPIASSLPLQTPRSATPSTPPSTRPTGSCRSRISLIRHAPLWSRGSPPTKVTWTFHITPTLSDHLRSATLGAPYGFLRPDGGCGTIPWAWGGCARW